MAVAFANNTTTIQEMFRRVAELYTAPFGRNAFLHLYSGEGMDKLELTEAENNMNDLAKKCLEMFPETAEKKDDYETF